MNKVLVIDNEESLSRVVEGLTAEGFEVVGASSGTEALSIAATAPPDVVVLEVELPGGLDGFEVIGRLLGRHPDLPVIVHTNTHQAISSYLACTAVDCLRKGEDTSELANSLRRILRWREKLVHGVPSEIGI